MNTFFLEVVEVSKVDAGSSDLCFIRQEVTDKNAALRLLADMKAHTSLVELFKGSYRALLHECTHLSYPEGKPCTTTILEAL